MELGDAARVDRAGDELLRLGEQHGLPQWLTWGRLFRGWAAMKEGDFDAGLDDARTALVAAHGMGFDTMRPYFLSSLAALCTAAGRDEDARMLLVDPVEEAPLRS
jgi:predicted ATPase